MRLVFRFKVPSERFACVVIQSGCCPGGTDIGGGWVRGEASEPGAVGGEPTKCFF